MSKVNIFLDSSALIAGILSETGAAHVLLQLGESEYVELTVSEWVIDETIRSVARKTPDVLDEVGKTITKSKIKIVADPSNDEVRANFYLMEDPYDVPILLAAMKASVDYLATHDRKHFLDDPKVAENSGLRIGTPGDALAWLRENL